MKITYACAIFVAAFYNATRANPHVASSVDLCKSGPGERYVIRVGVQWICNGKVFSVSQVTSGEEIDSAVSPAQHAIAMAETMLAKKDADEPAAS